MFLGYDKGFGFNCKPLGGQTRYSLHFKGITGCCVKNRCQGTTMEDQKPMKRLLLYCVEKWFWLELWQ